MPTSLSHVLICRTDNIGDVVLTLPLAAFLKRQHPGLRVDFLCRAYAAPVVRQCRFVDQVVALESLDDLTAYFAGCGADTVIFAYPQRTLATAAKRAGIGRRVGTSHRLYHWFTCNKLAHFSRVKSPLHEAQLNFALLRPLGIDVVPTLAEIAPLYGLTAPQRADIDALFAPFDFNLIFHPKSNGNGREWPIARYAELARLLQADPGIRIWVTGSAAEGAWLAEHGSQLLQMPNVNNVCGTVDLEGLTAAIGAADCLVASGTGPLHMSAALGRPTIGLFPPVKPIDPARWGALGERAESLCADRACGQCGDARSCGCMEAITAQQVEQAVLRWRRAAPRGRSMATSK
ncbi:MAG: glycosyltransferase family 9 protein [Pseudomonadota bacterium]